MGFKRDKHIGKIGETLVIDTLEHFGFNVQPNTDKKKLAIYDLIVTGPPDFTVEVKYDLYATTSGNIAIEYFNPKTNKASGIMKTTAAIWAHVVDNKIYFIPVLKLLTIVKTSVPSPHKIITYGGDNNASLLLYRIDDILDEHFVNIDKSLSKKEFTKIIKEMLDK